MLKVRLTAMAAALLLLAAWIAPAGMFAQPQPQPQPQPVTAPRKPLPFYVPDSTLFVLSAPNVPQSLKDVNNWNIKKLIDLPEMQGLLKPLLTELNKQIEQQTKALGEKTGLTVETILNAFVGQISLAVLDVTTRAAEEGGMPGGPMPLSPSQFESARVLAAIDIDRSAEAFGKVFAVFQKALGEKATLETKESDGVEITEVKPKEGKAQLAYAIYNQTLFLATGRDVLESTFKLYKSPTAAGTLGESTTYKKVRAGLPSGGEMVFSFLNVEAAFAKARVAMPADSQENFDKGYKASGMNGLKAFGANIVLRDGVMRDHFFFYAPGVRKGVLQLLSLPATPMATLKFVPENAISYQSMSLDTEIIWATIEDLARASGEEGYQRMQDQLAQMKEQGFDLKDGLFGAIGGEVADWSYYDASNKPQSVGYISLRNPEAFGKLLDAAVSKLIENIENGAGIPLNISSKDIAGSKFWVVDMSKMQEDQLAMMENNLPPAAFEEFKKFMENYSAKVFYVGVAKNAALLATSPADIELIAKGEGYAKNLGGTAEFTKAREQGFAAPSVFAWQNWPKVIEPIYHLAHAMVQAAREEMKNGGNAPQVPFDLTFFPKLEDVQKFIVAGTSLEMRNTADGILVRSRFISGIFIFSAGVGAATAQMRRGGQVGPGEANPGGENNKEEK